MRLMLASVTAIAVWFFGAKPSPRNFYYFAYRRIILSSYRCSNQTTYPEDVMPKTIIEPSCNTNFRVNLPTLVILFSSLFLSTAGQAADPVGTLKFARGDITIESESGETRKAVKGDNLMQNELVVTGSASIAVIQLNDNSRMTLRPHSEFRIDLLDTDGDSKDSGNQPSAVLNLLRGGLRLVTGLIGKLNPAGYRLSTPVATIGIRGTEFNSRICISDCAAEEKQLAGSDAAEKIAEGLYVNVDEGQVFLDNGATGKPLDLAQGESGYVADSSSLPVKLSSVPAFQSMDKVPSPSQLDFGNIQLSDGALQAIESAASSASAGATEAAAVAAASAGAVGVAVVAAASTSAAEAAKLDVTGTYEAEISYTATMALSDRKWFFGANPDIEFTVTQKGNKISGEFSGDRDGKIFSGKIDGDEIDIEFYLEARGGETKDGVGTWTVDEDGTLKGSFEIRDSKRGIAKGHWTLTKTD